MLLEMIKNYLIINFYKIRQEIKWNFKFLFWFLDIVILFALSWKLKKTGYSHYEDLVSRDEQLVCQNNKQIMLFSREQLFHKTNWNTVQCKNL